jgi:hypothetical protein
MQLCCSINFVQLMHNAQDKRLYIYSYIYLFKIILKSWGKCILLSYFAKDPIDGNHLHNQRQKIVTSKCDTPMA